MADKGCTAKLTLLEEYVGRAKESAFYFYRLESFIVKEWQV